MDSYFDLMALPNPEILQSDIVASLMMELHRRLPSFDGSIGLDFPAYGQHRTLGGIIRVLGPKSDLTTLHGELSTSNKVTDYGLLRGVSQIPDQIKQNAKFQRRHVKGSSHLKRAKKRHGDSETLTQERKDAMEKKFSTSLHMPHVKTISSSTGQRFLLFVERQMKIPAKNGKFNAYGLSLGDATVPQF